MRILLDECVSQKVRAGKHRPYRFVMLVALSFCGSVAIADAQTRSHEGAQETSAKVHRLLSDKEADEEDQSMASFSAALALGENGSRRALDVLQKVEPLEKPQDPYSDVVEVIEEIQLATHWITEKSANNPSISAEGKSDSEQVKQNILENAFFADEARADFSIDDITFTSDKARALASVGVSLAPRYDRGYDIVLEHRSGKWQIIGIWPTWIT